jgi:hypothetical protein
MNWRCEFISEGLVSLLLLSCIPHIFHAIFAGLVSFYPSIRPSIHLPIYLSVSQSVSQTDSQSVNQSVYLPTYVPTFLSTYLSTYVSIYGSTALLLGLGRFFSFLIFYTVGWTPWTGNQPLRKATTCTQGSTNTE